MSANAQRGYSLRTFHPDGTPDGVRFVEKSNWTGRCVVCPRSKFKEAKVRPEFDRTGVYVLVGPSDESDLPTIYIGEGDPALDRLVRHYAQKDFWTSLVLFVSKDDNLNKAHVQYLESRLCTLAREAKRSVMENATDPQLPSLSEPDVADVESFLSEMLLIYPSLGLHVFEKPERPPTVTRRYFLRTRDIEAEGYEAPNGFVVLAGSQVAGTFVQSAAKYLQTLRTALQERGVIANLGGELRVTQDYTFDSPSTAAGVVAGCTVNGREAWKDESGCTLKANQGASVAGTE